VTNKKQEFGQFFTPAGVAHNLIEMAAILPGELVLEPSAGEGALARAARQAGGKVVCVEQDQRLFRALSRDFVAFHIDFLKVSAETLPYRFDVIVMNPPFAPIGTDIAHVEHALRFLRTGGRLVAIMSAGVRFHQTKKALAFRGLVDGRKGVFRDLPSGSFAESGTNVNTTIVSMTV
jgi:predicted RNA methylase